MEELFQEFGLRKNEQDVYLAILKAGKVSATRIARQTSVNRTTVYSVAKKLAQMGLITEDAGQKVSYFVAEEPEKFLVSLENEKRRIEERRAKAEKLITELKSLRTERQYSVPRIRFVEEGNLHGFLTEGWERWQKSADEYGNTWWGFQDDSFTRDYERWIRWAGAESPQDLEICLFFNDVPLEESKVREFSFRKAKKLPTGVQFDASIWVAGDYLIMIQTRVRPHYLVEIHDEVLARNQRVLFQSLWSLAPDFLTKKTSSEEKTPHQVV